MLHKIQLQRKRLGDELLTHASDVALVYLLLCTDIDQAILSRGTMQLVAGSRS